MTHFFMSINKMDMQVCKCKVQWFKVLVKVIRKKNKNKNYSILSENILEYKYLSITFKRQTSLYARCCNINFRQLHFR